MWIVWQKSPCCQSLLDWLCRIIALDLSTAANQKNLCSRNIDNWGNTPWVLHSERELVTKRDSIIPINQHTFQVAMVIYDQQLSRPTKRSKLYWVFLVLLTLWTLPSDNLSWVPLHFFKKLSVNIPQPIIISSTTGFELFWHSLTQELQNLCDFVKQIPWQSHKCHGEHLSNLTS